MDPLAGNYDPLATQMMVLVYTVLHFNVDMTCVDPSTYTTVHLESPILWVLHRVYSNDRS